MGTKKTCHSMNGSRNWKWFLSEDQTNSLHYLNGTCTDLGVVLFSYTQVYILLTYVTKSSTCRTGFWMNNHEYTFLPLPFLITVKYGKYILGNCISTQWIQYAIIKIWLKFSSSPWTKWPPFHRRHFEILFHLNSNFTGLLLRVHLTVSQHWLR